MIYEEYKVNYINDALSKITVKGFFFSKELPGI